VIQVENYLYGTSQMAQTTLRSVCGQADLDELLAEREQVNQKLQEIIDSQTEPWGVKVRAVEVKQIDLPVEMQRAMARQAEAEREKRSKVIHAEGEFQASQRLADAARVLASQESALQLRYLQTLAEIATENNSTTLFPIPIDILRPFYEMARKADPRRSARRWPSDEPCPTEQRVRRSVARTLGNLTLGTVLVARSACGCRSAPTRSTRRRRRSCLRLGRHVGDRQRRGLPLDAAAADHDARDRERGPVRSEDFGDRGARSGRDASALVHESSMQTSDNNIVRVSFTVQYRVSDPYAARYRIADLPAIVRSASAAAMREVVGRMTVDGVLRERRAELTSEAAATLQRIFDGYSKDMIDVQAVQLQDVQAPAAVRAAFDDVVAAIQDASRHVNEAQGYQNQVIPNARAEAVELIESANGLPRRADRRGDRRVGALQGARGRVPQGSGSDAQASLSRDDGGCAARASRR
jgi:regulator of protease activity HflC (stomatin/prohibitin superfamily)